MRKNPIFLRRQWTWNVGGKGLDLAALDDDPNCERDHLYMTYAEHDPIVMRCTRCGHEVEPGA